MRFNETQRSEHKGPNKGSWETDMATERSTKSVRTFGRLVGGLAAATLMSLAAAHLDASTTVACGITLSGDHTYVLTEDIGPCTGPGPAITIQGPAVLKLNGWTVSCAHEIELTEVVEDPPGIPVAHAEEGSIGIALTGYKAELRGAGSSTSGANPDPENAVIGCDRNVVVEGEGDHEVKGVTSLVAVTAAFVVTSDENELTGNVVKQYFYSPDALLRPIKSGGTGFTIEGDKNVLYRNVAADSWEHGFQIDGNENRMEDNVARDNDEYGVVVEGGENRVRSNSAAKNVAGGFLIGEEGEGNRLSHNVSSESGDGDPANGFDVLGSNNQLDSNTADHNGQFGIFLAETAGMNEVEYNAVSHSDDTDMVDESPACDENSWHGNIFGTRNRSCIK